MKLKCAFIFGILLLILDAYSNWHQPKHGDYAGLPQVSFVENMGQWEGPHQFKTKLGSSHLFLEKDKLTYTLIKTKSSAKDNHSHDYPSQGHSFKVNFHESSDKTVLRGEKKQETYHNYFLGNNESNWKSNVPLFNEVFYENIYDDIDMKIYQKDGFLKYDFIVAPHAKVENIVMHYEGVDGMFLSKRNLHIKTSVSEIIEQKPYAYQIIGDDLIEVPCTFKLNKQKVSFKFPKGYNKNHELIIDPVLIFSTFTGSVADNFGVTATYDNQGNGYAAGIVFNEKYPTTLGAFDITFSGDGMAKRIEADMGISKFTPNGSSMVYSTYLGGRFLDIPQSIIVDNNNSLVVLGVSGSNNFPTTNSAFDRTFNGGNNVQNINELLDFTTGTDLVITKFSANGSNLIGSTYLGGNANDGLNSQNEFSPNYADAFRGEVGVDAANNIYIASLSSSRNFPTTSGAAQPNYLGGRSDAVVAKLNTNLSSIIWSTYFGGSRDDAAFSMKLDKNNNVYFSGVTNSDNLPTNSNAINPNYLGGLTDGFIGLISNTGSSFLNSSYLGTSSYDLSFFIELDPAGDVYALGNAYGRNYPIQNASFSNPNSTQFLHKMKPNLDSTFFSTQIGNGQSNGELALNAFMIDDCYRIYFSAWGGSINGKFSNSNISGLPLSSDAFQRTTDGSDFYFCVLKPNASGLEYASYFGGNSEVGEHVDGGTSRFDRKGIIYQAVCAGCKGTSNFPTSSNAHSTVNGSQNCNLALVKFDFQLSEITVNANITPDTRGCAPFRANFINLSRGPIDIYEWDFGDGVKSNDISPSHIFDSGIYDVMLIGKSEYNCVDPDTARIRLEIFDPSATSKTPLIKCTEDAVLLASQHASSDATYEWNTTSRSESISALDPGIYWVKTLSSSGCFVDSFEVSNFPIPSSSRSIEGCEPKDYIVSPPNTTDPALAFEWSDGSVGKTYTIRDAGVFWVRTLDPNNCDRLDSFIVGEYPLKDPFIHNISLCPSKNVILRPTDLSGALAIFWYDGSTNDTLLADTPGVYWVRLEYEFECPQADSFFIEADEFNEFEIDSIRICEGTSIRIASRHIGPGGRYTWNTGSSDTSIVVGETGIYEVISDFDEICPYYDRFVVRAYPVIDENDIYFPNAFSPNNDGINDEFRPFFSPLVELLDYELKIYNRWGGKVFETKNPNEGWDGQTLKVADDLDCFVWHSNIRLVSCSGDPLNLVLKGEVNLML